MPKFRAQLSMGMLTKPIIVEAKSVEDAKRVFENLDASALMNHLDSLQVVLAGNVVRVMESEPVSVPSSDAPTEPKLISAAPTAKMD